MEIQKIFSNIEDPEETLYSVLMSEDEINLFSEIQKEFASIKNLKKVANISAKVNVQGGITKGQARSLNSAFRKTFKGKAVDDKTFRKVYKKPVEESIKAIAGNSNSEAIENALKVGRESENALKNYYTSRGGKLDPWMSSIPRIKK